MSDRNTPIDTLRISQAERDELLAMLNSRSAGDGEAENARRHTRVDFNAPRVAVTFLHPGGVETKCLVTARNISVAGIGFLHGGFLHFGSECVVELPTLYGDTRTIRGRVRACRHVSGNIHEIGLQFDREIDPYEFLEPGDAPSAGVLQTVDPATLKGSVLAIESSTADARLLQHHLKASEVTLEVKAEFAEAESVIASGGFGAVLMSDAALGPNGGADGLQDARAHGYEGPVVAMTAESKPEWLAAIRKIGYADVLVKPYDAAKLYAVLAQALPADGGARAGSGKIYSTLNASDDVGELLESFLKEVDATIKELHSLRRSGSFEKIRSVCLSLKGSGEGYGYPRFSDAAREVVDSIDKDADAERVEIDLKRLELVFQRLAPSTTPTEPDDAPAEEAA